MSSRSGQRPPQLVDTFRGEAVLATPTGELSVSCEVSEYRSERSHWRSGSISGDLRSLLTAEEPLTADLRLSGDRTLHIALDDLDESGATFEEVAPSPPAP